MGSANEVRNVPLLVSGRTERGDLHQGNTFSEVLENGLMYRYEVSVRREVINYENNTGSLLYDKFTARVKMETFHYGQRIKHEEVERVTRLTPWTEGPVPIMNFQYVGKKAIALFVAGQGPEFDGLEVLDDAFIQRVEAACSSTFGPIELADLLKKLKKEKKLIKKCMPEKFVIVFADVEDLLEQVKRLG